MIDLATIRSMFRYSDWANERVLESALGVAEADLDRPMDVGPGSMRRTLLHILAGEDVWLRRWMGQIETRWPDERERAGVSEIAERLRAVWARREVFVESLPDGAAGRVQDYRDSKGGLFRASLGDMLLQGCVHSIHHRAQAVNILRRLGAAAPELDYMMRVRQPSGG